MKTTWFLMKIAKAAWGNLRTDLSHFVLLLAAAFPCRYYLLLTDAMLYP